MRRRYHSYEQLTGSASAAKVIQEGCTDCGICVRECAFLTARGSPGALAKIAETDPEKLYAAAFECSLCRLCMAVCPLSLDPAAMFLEFRRTAVEKEKGCHQDHQKLMDYEARGRSEKYRFYSLPKDCDTIFFPGCSLAGARPDTILKAFHYLEKQFKNIGIVLDCCTRPSHDLGRQDHFIRMFSKLKRVLLKNRIQTIVVACPSCYQIFNTYGREFRIKTIYEVMEEKGIDDSHTVSGRVMVHDPCPSRFQTRIQDSVRSIIRARGLEIENFAHTREKTMCCGEGGGAAHYAAAFARNWTRKIIDESGHAGVISYCAGCVSLLNKKSHAFHVLDLVFDPEKAMSGKTSVSRAPMTYMNRLMLKKKLKMIVGRFNY